MYYCTVLYTQGFQAVDDDIKKYTTLSYRAPEMVDLYR